MTDYSCQQWARSGRTVAWIMPGICHPCQNVKAPFYPFLISQLSALIILLSVKGSIFTLIYLSIYCVPVGIKMTERSTCRSGAHSIQVEQNLSK